MATLPAFKTMVLPAQADDVLEVDEIFTFITVKIFHTVFGLFNVIGRGKTLLSLSVIAVWKVARHSGENFPTIINDVSSFSDFWRAYNCFPEETHWLVGKESGQTQPY